MTMRTDVAVVGAGIVGLSTAYAAVQQGLSVTVYDAFDGPPALVVPGWVFCSTCTISSATVSNSSWPKPRVVSAGVPMRTPDGSIGLRAS